MFLGYARVSTFDQNIESQISILKRHGCEKIFEDTCSGKNATREALNELMEFARDGDHILVCALDRLGRNVRDLRGIIDFFLSKKVNVTILHQNLNFFHDKTDPMTDLMFGFLSMIAEYERSLTLERQREGIARAKAAGKYKGRVPKMTEEEAKEAKYLKDLGVPMSQIARRFKVNRYTIYNHLRTLNKKIEFEEKEKLTQQEEKEKAYGY
jgi:DNA invertase Pin-like site-specific DNA recombinase